MYDLLGTCRTFLPNCLQPDCRSPKLQLGHNSYILTSNGNGEPPGPSSQLLMPLCLAQRFRQGFPTSQPSLCVQPTRGDLLSRPCSLTLFKLIQSPASSFFPIYLHRQWALLSWIWVCFSSCHHTIPSSYAPFNALAVTLLLVMHVVSLMPLTHLANHIRDPHSYSHNIGLWIDPDPINLTPSFEFERDYP